jgi:Icc-related predicted phosphoesterase
MVNFGRATQYMSITKTIDSSIGINVPIISCFGNEEFQDVRQEILNLTKGRITFLDGKSAVVEVAKSRLGLIGAPAPTDFRGGKRDINKIGLREIYESRAKHLSKLVRKTAAEADYSILLMHYSPLSESIDDSDVSEYSGWISKTIEDVQPDVVIHGHLHRATRLEVLIGKTRIINVAFPAVGKITEIVL